MTGRTCLLVTILCALLIATAVTAVVLWSSYRQDEEPPQVERLDTEQEPHIYFGTAGGGLQSYSLRTTQVKPVWGNKNDYVTGVTYDSVQDTIYWATETYIYKKNRTEDQVDRVLDMLGPPWNEKCGIPYALDLDWITGNLYVSASKSNGRSRKIGCIFVCRTSMGFAGPACALILSDLGDVHGIALNPPEGIVFWTTWDSGGTLNQAGMDGSNRTKLKDGLGRLEGITMDFNSPRLYWTVGGNGEDNKVESSDLNGTNVTLAFPIPLDGESASWPWGITLFGDAIFWTNSETKNLNRASMTGQTTTLLHTANQTLHHLVIAPHPSPTTNRKNDCENQNNCSSSQVCVLSPTSFKCVP